MVILEPCTMTAKITTDKNAVKKLLTGPATAVRMSSLTWFLKLRLSTGVGLAQPKGGKPSTIRISGIRMVPKGSMWARGFREIRPSILAVGSPNRLAIQAWADSCTQMANNNTMTWKKTSTGFVWENMGLDLILTCQKQQQAKDEPICITGLTR